MPCQNSAQTWPSAANTQEICILDATSVKFETKTKWVSKISDGCQEWLIGNYGKTRRCSFLFILTRLSFHYYMHVRHKSCFSRLDHSMIHWSVGTWWTMVNSSCVLLYNNSLHWHMPDVMGIYIPAVMVLDSACAWFYLFSLFLPWLY